MRTRLARCKHCGEPIFERPWRDERTEWAHTRPFDRADMTICGRVPDDVGVYRAAPIPASIS